MKARALYVGLSFLLVGLGCGGCHSPKRGVVTLGDGGTKHDGGDAGPGLTACDDAHLCAMGDRCHDGFCIHDNGTCTDDNGCENDTYCKCASGGGDAGVCTGGVCVPWGTPPGGAYDPSCQAPSFSVTAFQSPTVKCHWTDPSGGESDVISTPIVVDLDGDGKPEIVFAAGYNSARLTAIHGADCTPLWQNTTQPLQLFTQIAAADLDGDKIPEIVGITSGGLTVFDNKGNVLGTTAASSGACSGPAIADVDNVAPPEIVVDAAVFRYTKSAGLVKLFQQAATPAVWGNISLFADLDGDNRPEVVTGLEVYDGVSGANKTPSALGTLGGTGAYPAIADFNGDGKPDIVNVQSAAGGQQVSVLDYANNKIIFGPYTVAGGGWGGPPTVGDYDGDGVPDFGLASTDHYYVYALKCAKTPKPADCTGTDPGVLWEKDTHDQSSGGTASSTFDFNGDGVSEVVYRDECWLRVYNGPDGKAVFAQTITSGTCLEYPVIADVDNDGHADLVVPSDRVQESFTSCPMTPEADTQTPWGGYTSGIFVLQDPQNRWQPSRPLWASHSYHITEINDDTSVPTIEPANWKTYNNYRKNVQGNSGGGAATADPTAQAGSVACGSTTLTVQLCNRGSAPIAPGLPGAFYASDPTTATTSALCTTMTQAAIDPGKCETETCTWVGAPAMSKSLWFRADDDGNKHPASGECKNGNDVSTLVAMGCGPVL